MSGGSTANVPLATTSDTHRKSMLHPPPCNLPPFVRPVPPQGGDSHEVTVRGGGGVMAPPNCTIVSQRKSASAPSATCNNFLWRLWRLVFSMLFGPSDDSPPGGG